MGATLVDGFDSSSGEGKGNCFLEFGYVDTFLLQVRILALHTCRVELGSTSPVGVTPTHLGTFVCNWAFLSHSRQHITLYIDT